jgi:aryl-alcohol dehydrogenase-like predicted oxidoreductase
LGKKTEIRHIDTAQGYKNEEQVGRAITDSGISRDEIFVSKLESFFDFSVKFNSDGLATKVKSKFRGYRKCFRGVDESLKELGTGKILFSMIALDLAKAY